MPAMPREQHEDEVQARLLALFKGSLSILLMIL